MTEEEKLAAVKEAWRRHRRSHQVQQELRNHKATRLTCLELIRSMACLEDTNNITTEMFHVLLELKIQEPLFELSFPNYTIVWNNHVLETGSFFPNYKETFL